MAQIYISLNKSELSKLEEISDITQTNYEIKDSLVDIESVWCALEDLLYEYHNLQEEHEDYKEYTREHYEPRRFNPYKEYGISESDFH